MVNLGGSKYTSKMSVTSINNSPSVSKKNSISDTTNDQSRQPGRNETLAGTSGAATTKRKPSKFTRGEKCLFAHIVVTFALLLLLFIIFVVHLYMVKHHGDEMFLGLLRRRVAAEQPNYTPIGVVNVLPDNYMCNCLLLRPRWSLAPAHCVAARSDPDLAHDLLNWRILYGVNIGLEETESFSETRITRSVPHPHFNRDDFQNNIGLFQHADSLSDYVSNVYLSDISLSDQFLGTNANDLQLIGWENSLQLHGHITHNPVQPLTSEKCKQYVSPVVDKRDYEYCVTLKARRNVTIVPGAVLAMKSDYVGIFTWGDSKGRGLPFVILDLAHYRDWLLHIVSARNVGGRERVWCEPRKRRFGTYFTDYS